MPAGQYAAQTTTTSTSQAVKDRYYDELFLRVAEANLVHQQLGQINRAIPKGENATTIYWTRWVNLATISTGQGEGIPTTALTLSAVNVTGTGAQYDAAVSISDLMALQSFGDVMKAAMQRIAYQAGLSIDTITRNAVVNSGTQQLAGGVSGTYTSVPYTANLSLVELRKAMRTLEKNNAFRVGGNQNANEAFLNNGYWLAVISPDAKYDLEGDTTTGAWIDANRYAGSENLFTGEVGKLYGIRFLQTANAVNNGSGLIATATQTYNVHTTLVTGSDYFGVTTLQNLQTFIKDFGSGGTGDPTNKVATVGWKCQFGATVLNSAFAVSLYQAVSN